MAQLASLTPELVGRRYPVFKFQVTEPWVRDYKEALGFPPELCADATFVPPLFIACLRDAEFYIFEDLGIKLSQLLHASQRYEFDGKLKVGDNLEVVSEVASLRRKDGKAGSMIFLELANAFELIDKQSSERSVVIRSFMTVVVRTSPNE